MLLIDDLSQLIFPTRCYGCNRLGLEICTECRREWIPHYYKTQVQHLKVHSALLYTTIASKILLAAKENSIQGADYLLISAITHVLRKAKLDSQYFQLVPIPSSKSSQRRRGRSFIVDVTKKISHEVDLPINDCLQITRRVADQSGLSREQRKINLEGAFSVRPGAILRGDLILIDDVVTTGATLSEAARALNSQPFHAIGTVSAVTACVAQPLR
jgi:predicted amidophosphoribosyltransferase